MRQLDLVVLSAKSPHDGLLLWLIQHNDDFGDLHLFYGYFKWPVPQMPRAPTTSATCVWEGKKFRKEAKGKFLTNIQCFPPSPPAAPTPRTPLQPCSELAGVFLYKRPILWDARIAMEAFEGHHTKAQRQKGRL